MAKHHGKVYYAEWEHTYYADWSGDEDSTLTHKEKYMVDVFEGTYFAKSELFWTQTELNSIIFSRFSISSLSLF